MTPPGAAAAVPALTLPPVEERSPAALHRYAAALVDACERHPPPYGTATYGDQYRDLASDPQWLAHSLVSNAEKEGEGSTTLWRLAARVTDRELSEQVRRHAIDEANHARYYVMMLDLAFPGAVTADLRPHLASLSPGYTPRHRLPRDLAARSYMDTLDDIVQINIGEIRTRIHQLLLQPVITAHCPPGSRPRLRRILRRLLADETRHIAYTAALIEAASEQVDGRHVSALVSRRLADFNTITRYEVGLDEFEL